ncbi:O-antigen ligase family protein [Runella aurantiaca]|uniref:O-antigen ligase domain-containing protein n=1 Tax=Runella aurantiaca TaxID=2282308 RepID=A0A369I760_9BACT|nr:O-antigen ligase family protein [Runella aurantiaca]RDB04730.1 hypothetical protein DVG78_17375 [Runella aurantiaca]
MNYERLVLVYSSLILLSISSLAQSIGFESLKYIRFLTPIVLLFLPFLEVKNKKINDGKIGNKYIFNIGKLFIFIVLLTVLTNTFVYSIGLTYRNFVNFVFLLSPLFALYLINLYVDYDDLRKVISFQFYNYIVIYLAELILKGVSFQSILSSLSSNYITNSSYETESGSSLIFGFYSIYFLHYKRYQSFVLSVLFVILGAKRIAIFGLVLSLIVLYFYPFIYNKIIRNVKNTFCVVFALVMLLLANFWTILYTGKFDSQIHDLIGVSPNAFFMGRLSRISTFFSLLKDKDDFFLGYGIGYAENILYYFMKLPTPFHNDFYKFYFEFGPFLFLLWCYFMVKFAIIHPLSFSSFFLLLILMQTDNVYTYETVMYSFYFVTIISFKETLKGRKVTGS